MPRYLLSSTTVVWFDFRFWIWILQRSMAFFKISDWNSEFCWKRNWIQHNVCFIKKILVNSLVYYYCVYYEFLWNRRYLLKFFWASNIRIFNTKSKHRILEDLLKYSMLLLSEKTHGYGILQENSSRILNPISVSFPDVSKNCFMNDVS